MPYNPDIHHRRSVRLKGYDYSQAGLYFITICCHDRECLFGRIKNDEMILNDAGKIADEYLRDIPNHFSHIEMGEYIIMPNHVHCVLVLNNKMNIVGTRHVVSLHNDTDIPVGTSHVMSLQPPLPEIKRNQFSKPIPGSVSVIIQQYKSSVKRWCNKNGHEYFKWQSRFHDHIIRDEKSYRTISEYIINNPANWKEDKFFK